MELIRGVDRDPYKARIAAKLLEMAKSLGVETVVEGVETAGEWGWARDNGADFAQGFLLARPAAPPPKPESWAAWMRAPTSNPSPRTRPAILRFTPRSPAAAMKS